MRFPSILRRCLEEDLKRECKKIKAGKTLYIGCETNTYKKTIPHTTFQTMDIEKKNKPDIIGDIHNIPLKKETYDTVVALQVIEHCQNPKKAIQEMIRITKPKGTIIISAPFIFYYHKSPKDYYRFTEDALKDLTKNTKNRKIIPQGNRIITIWQLLSKGKHQPIMHLLNPLIKKLDNKKPKQFAMNYLLIANKKWKQ